MSLKYEFRIHNFVNQTFGIVLIILNSYLIPEIRESNPLKELIKWARKSLESGPIAGLTCNCMINAQLWNPSSDQTTNATGCGADRGVVLKNVEHVQKPCDIPKKKTLKLNSVVRSKQ